jgi:hypothetical protein
MQSIEARDVVDPEISAGRIPQCSTSERTRRAHPLPERFE